MTAFIWSASSVHAQQSAPPVDKKLSKELQRLAKSIKPQTYPDGQLVGATVEGRDIVVRYNLVPQADAPNSAKGAAYAENFAAGFCSPQVVNSLSESGIGYELRFYEGGAIVFSARMDVPACQSYWKRIADVGQSASANNQVPAFEFKGIVAGEPINVGIFKSCYGPVAAAPTCSLADESAGGVKLYPRFGLYRSRLSTVTATIHTSEYPTLKRALEAKYGPPTTEVPSSWQNKAGAVFDNLTTSWLFRSGTLALVARGTKIDESVLLYIDSNAPPDAPPVVDF